MKEDVSKIKQAKPKRAEKKEMARLQEEIESLGKDKEALLQEKEEVFGKLQRVTADYANFQKRSGRQITESIAYEKEAVVKTLLPVLDNFEHTLKNLSEHEIPSEHIKGVQIVYDHMLDVLKSHGIEQIRAVGEIFDPAVHQAIVSRYEEGEDENSVLEDFQKGYKLNGRVIRPSKVVVNKPPSEEEIEPDNQE